MNIDALITTLYSCRKACLFCADACLDEEDIADMSTCIRLDHHCAILCATTADLLVQSYGNIDELLKLCIEACKACADVCSQHKHDHCQKCAASCRECITACENYLSRSA
ncbi:four-helix bundle copper-binding protein [Aquimarina intermedia]|uniref:Uncharacterized protein DUF326 n=1 Tax=Aquimarina intermedia TaxID=350814 RepID=A0A5S5BUH4_9FLAO|nr:four-helix bundle copper-binding protein [Aquimarina intermedia]TYP69966.1 uncharacterized protein DUF326 [Aquimarina intermedia]